MNGSSCRGAIVPVPGDFKDVLEDAKIDTNRPILHSIALRIHDRAIEEAPVFVTVTHQGVARDVRVPHKKALIAADTGRHRGDRRRWIQGVHEPASGFTHR